MTDAFTVKAFTPEGHFMCCICFGFFPVDEAVVDSSGEKWDVCEADREAAEIAPPA